MIVKNKHPFLNGLLMKDGLITKSNSSVSDQLVQQLDDFAACSAEQQYPLVPGLLNIGCGYNLSERYASTFGLKWPIFDYRSLELGYPVEIDGKTFSSYKIFNVIPHSESNKESICQMSSNKYRKDLTVKSGVKTGIGLFAGEVKHQFSESTVEDASNSFMSIIEVLSLYTVTIMVDKLKEVMSDAAKKAINEGNLDSLFNDYGTHILVGGIFGGRATISATANTKENRIDKSTSIDVSASYSNIVSGNFEFKKSNSSQSSISLLSQQWNTSGGLPNISIETKEGMGEWIKSVDGASGVLIDFTSPLTTIPLVEISEFANTPERQQAIKEAIKQYLDDNNPPFVERYEKKYTVVVTTSGDKHAGTDSKIEIQLNGELGNSEFQRLDNDNDNFEKNDVDTFYLTTLDCGGLTSIVLKTDASGDKPGWKPSQIKITVDKTSYIFENDQWLDKYNSSITLTPVQS